MAASAAMILNAVKTLADLADDIPVISTVLESAEDERKFSVINHSAAKIVMFLTMSTDDQRRLCTQRLYKLRG